MPFLAFLGCDGSGKSAVIEGVTRLLEERELTVTPGHWRPVAVARGSGPDAGGAADDPHGQSPRGAISSMLKLGWLWLNWWGGWWGHLRNASKTGVVLFDRYHADLLIDPRRYRYGGAMSLARLACAGMPRPDRVFFLDASPEVLLSRKQEVSCESLERLRVKYLELASVRAEVMVIDASKPLNEVIDEIVVEIERLRHTR